MKLTSQLFALAAVTTLSTGGAFAGGPEQNTAATNHSAVMNGQSATESFPKHSWERGQLLKTVGQKLNGTDTVPAIKKHAWERGELLNLMRDQQLGAADLDAEAITPRVKIYYDASGTQPGLPRDLGNTHAGRSIMLKYLEQARNNAS
jgi:hypothetical protein